MYFKRVLKIVFTFKKYFMLNILFSVLYAFFSAVAFLSLMPMLEVLFNGINKINEKPTLELSSNLGHLKAEQKIDKRKARWAFERVGHAWW